MKCWMVGDESKNGKGKGKASIEGMDTKCGGNGRLGVKWGGGWGVGWCFDPIPQRPIYEVTQIILSHKCNLFFLKYFLHFIITSSPIHLSKVPFGGPFFQHPLNYLLRINTPFCLFHPLNVILGTLPSQPCFGTCTVQ